MSGSDDSTVSASVGAPVYGITPMPIYVAGGVSLDNTSYSDPNGPASLNQGDLTTKVDTSSLDAAVTWLTQIADYLLKMHQGMSDLKTLTDGPTYDSTTVQHSGGGQLTPFGGFPGAQDMAKKAASLYTSYHDGLKNVVNDLYDAADALKQIKAQYTTAENANKMTAAQLESIFGDANKHSMITD